MRREAIHRFALELLTGLQRGAGELRIVGGIREVLRLERQPVATRVHFAALAGDAAIQEVAGVELDARFRGQDGAMHQQIRITANWRGKMRISLQSQTKMAFFIRAVNGLGHGAQ